VWIMWMKCVDYVDEVWIMWMKCVDYVDEVCGLCG
jgi:hypothetical protein